MIARHRLRWRIQHWLEGRFPGLMTCAEFQETLDDYLDGTLGGPARMMVDFHMRTCPACRRYVAAYGAVRAAAAGAYDSALRDGLTGGHTGGGHTGGGPGTDGMDAIPEELVVAIKMAREAETNPQATNP